MSSRSTVRHAALILGISIGLCPIGSCSSSDVNGLGQQALASAVVGGWTLVQGCGGIAYHCSSPSALAAPDRVVFHANGTVEQFRAGKKIAKGAFVITPSSTDSLREGTATVSPWIGATIETLALRFSIEGELLLAESCCDRFAYVYQRN